MMTLFLLYKFCFMEHTDAKIDKFFFLLESQPVLCFLETTASVCVFVFSDKENDRQNFLLRMTTVLRHVLLELWCSTFFQQVYHTRKSQEESLYHCHANSRVAPCALVLFGH